MTRPRRHRGKGPKDRHGPRKTEDARRATPRGGRGTPRRGGSGRPKPIDLGRAIALTHDRLVEARQAARILAGSGPPSIVLDAWQARTLAALEAGNSVVVDAPTTAGKTLAVERFFEAHIEQPGFRAAYTTPVKSLTHDKVREFRAKYGANRVGIATGDVKENLDAPIVVATLECYRNSLLGLDEPLHRRLVVFDEYHYIQDPSRGSAWEEAILLSPTDTQLLLLSASVENAEAFVEWLSSIRQETCELIRTTHRPVPLESLVFVNGQWVLESAVPRPALQQLDRDLLDRPAKPVDIARAIQRADALGLSPTIAYVGKRVGTEILAVHVARSLDPMPEAALTDLRARVQALHAETDALRFLPPDLQRLIMESGVAYHHSGLAHPVRILVESLLKEGRLRVVTASMGLSLGINFSVRSTLISDYERPGDQGFVTYRPAEIMQMVGRAGRRGKDAVGFVLWPNPESRTVLGPGHREPCPSNLRADPTTLLSLIGQGLSNDKIESMFERSFRQFVEPDARFELLPKEAVHELLKYPATSRGRRQLTRLSAIQVHLHRIGALDPDGHLTPLGNIGRFLPQSGGLLVAQMLSQGIIEPANIIPTAELLADLSLAWYREPGEDEDYVAEFDEIAMVATLEKLYPIHLFPELYDTGRGPGAHRRPPRFRDFNPSAGSMVRLWANPSQHWEALAQTVCTETFGDGDAMNVILRVCTYLQSLAHAARTIDPRLASAARRLRQVLFRPPVGVGETLEESPEESGAPSP